MTNEKNIDCISIMNRIALFLIAMLFAFGAQAQLLQNSYIQKGLVFDLPATEWSTQPGATLTNSVLVSGKMYRIVTFATGDDFANVGAGSNATGVIFRATGTAPTTWSNGSVLRQLDAYAVDAISKNHGSATGIISVPGQYGEGADRYYSFDGVDDKIALTSSGSVYCFAIHFYTPVAISKATSAQGLLAINGSSNYCGLGLWTGSFADEIVTVGSGPNFSYWADATATIPAGWNTLFVNWETDRYHIYLNGTKKTSSKFGTPAIMSASSVIVGSHSGTGGFYNGSTKSLYFFNYAVTDSIASWSAKMLAGTFVMPAADRGATNAASIAAGSFVAGLRYRIDSVGTTNFTAIGASANTAGVVFVATGAGSGNGAAFRVGSTLSLDASGLYPSIWHDYDHAVTGTVSGATLTKPKPSNFGSYEFNGTSSKIDFVSMGHNLTGDITYVDNFRFLPFRSGYLTLFDNGQFRVAVDYNSGDERIIVYSDNSTGATSATIEPNTWYNLVVTRGSTGTTNIYIDGVLSGTADQSSGTPAAGTSYYRGSDGGSASYFTGRTGWSGIYGRILSSDEISRTYIYRR